jgi:hypothetical protein
VSERRHRISGCELPHVVSAIESQLREWLQYRRTEDMDGAEQLFRLWWRVMEHRKGRPRYPEPITWEVIWEHLEAREMVPLQIDV